MKSFIEKNILRNAFCLFFAMSLLVIAGISTSWAANQNVGGVACAAYNNNQANKLERSHVRLLNPLSNTLPLWVICAVQRDTADLSTGNSVGYVQGFWDSGVTGDMTCIWREFDRDTIHTPGGDLDSGNTINSESFTITAPVTTPGSSLRNVTLTTPNTSTQYYWTFACKLAPGQGVNMYGINHQ